MILVICGPGGGGKTTQVDKLRDRTNFKPAITVTTRPRRQHEIDGIHYHFVTKDTFASWKQEGKFAESATVFGNEYGILARTILDAREKGSNLILNIDIQGYRTVRNHPDRILAGAVKGIFLMPPSMKVLEERLRSRKDTSEEAIVYRLSIAPLEMASSLEIGFFDSIIITYDQESTYGKIMRFIDWHS